MTPTDLDRLDDIAHRAEHGPYESLTALDNEMLRAFPALVAEVRRLRRGVEHWPCSSCGGRGVYPRRKCPYCNATGLDERAVNLLAGREWSDNGEVERG